MKKNLPENVVLIYVTPINRYGINDKEYNNRIIELIKSYQIWIKNNDLIFIFRSYYFHWTSI